VEIHLHTYKTTYTNMFAHYIHAFLLIYCMTPCESSGRFFRATRCMALSSWQQAWWMWQPVIL